MRGLSTKAAQELYKKGLWETRRDKTQARTIKRNVISSQKHKQTKTTKKSETRERTPTSGLIFILKVRILIICDSDY